MCKLYPAQAEAEPPRPRARGRLVGRGAAQVCNVLACLSPFLDLISVPFCSAVQLALAVHVRLDWDISSG